MILGFTGTRQPLTLLQRATLRSLVGQWPITELHHGDCIGADAWMHELVRELRPEVFIVGHPCFGRQRANCWCDEDKPLERPLDRNRHIVAASQFMVAAPATDDEQLRSGTWATVRYTRQAAKPLILVLPTRGSVMERVLPGIAVQRT